MLDKELYESAKAGKQRAGRTHLLNYLQGKRLTRLQAMDAHCYDCDGMGDSGECNLISCALWPYSKFGRAWLRKKG